MIDELIIQLMFHRLLHPKTIQCTDGSKEQKDSLSLPNKEEK
jgi:hypothetical protein